MSLLYKSVNMEFKTQTYQKIWTSYKFLVKKLVKKHVEITKKIIKDYKKAFINKDVHHSMQDQQDLRKFRGLISFLPFTYTAILVGSLSLMAFPF